MTEWSPWATLMLKSNYVTLRYVCYTRQFKEQNYIILNVLFACFVFPMSQVSQRDINWKNWELFLGCVCVYVCVCVRVRVCVCVEGRGGGSNILKRHSCCPSPTHQTAPCLSFTRWISFQSVMLQLLLLWVSSLPAFFVVHIVCIRIFCGRRNCAKQKPSATMT